MALAVAFNVLYVATFDLYGPPLRPSDIYPNYVPPSWIPAFVLGYLPALWLVLRPFPLWHRPDSFADWPRWRRGGYVVLWGWVLGLIVLVGVGGAWLVWRHLLGPMLGSQPS